MNGMEFSMRVDDMRIAIIESRDGEFRVKRRHEE